MVKRCEKLKRERRGRMVVPGIARDLKGGLENITYCTSSKQTIGTNQNL
jgi:hypothetical protein